jgi:predicted negative regulator of RcsB-dependent stress response
MNLRLTSFFLLVCFLLQSCSWVSRSRRDFVQKDDQSKPQKEKGPVSRDEYNSLLKKYNEMKKRLEVRAVEKESDSDLMESLNNLPASSSSVELSTSVDPFKGTPSRPAQSTSPMIDDMSAVAQTRFEKHLMKLKQAKKFVDKKNFDKAMENLQQLEQSPFRQIRVRAKFFIGSILLDQKEFDLAMQVFEEMIQKYAFSGMTIHALKGLVTAASKLKLDEKLKRYESLLNQVFKRA